MSPPQNKKRKKVFKHSTSFYRKVSKQLLLDSESVPSMSIEQNTNKITPIEQATNSFSVNSNKNTLCPCAESELSNKNQNVNEVLVEDDEVLEDATNLEQEEPASEISFGECLKDWALEYNINHSALSALLILLHQKLPGLNYLPKCAKTLLKTKPLVNIVPMGKGDYWHNGLENCLRKLFSNLDKPKRIHLTINIDGLPIQNSSKKEFWPILFTVQEIPKMQPMVIGIYSGDTKPNLQDYLSPFVSELKDVMDNGIFINFNKLNVSVRCFVCDTPARSFIKGTVSSNAYHGCTKCTVMGEYYSDGHHMSYPRTDMPLRTDTSFREKTDPDHHKEDTPLLKLPIDMIEQFPVSDALHLFDLGIMKRCLKGWVTGSYNFRTKWSAKEIDEISDRLIEFNETRPTELHRSVRRLDCLSFWKGLEFRTFLLYLGPVVLKDYLQVDVYHHFLQLCCAVIICSNRYYSEYLNVADVLFKEYVEKFIDIYGIDSISSNIHSLCHVVKDVELFGHLPTFHAYPFESFLGRLKHLLRSGNRPLAQVAKRLNELSNSNTYQGSQNMKFKPYVKIRRKHPTANFKNIFYFLKVAEGFVLQKNIKDEWFMTKDREIVRMRFATVYEDKICISGSSIKKKTDFFTRPVSSSRLNIYVSPMEKNNNPPKMYELSSIKCKMMSIKYGNELVFMPILHTLDSVNQ